MESALYSLFEVNLENSVKNDLLISKNYNFQPSEFLHKPYYYFELILDNIKEIQDAEEKDKQEQNKNANYNPNKMASNMMNNMPHSIMPQINLPHF